MNHQKFSFTSALSACGCLCLALSFIGCRPAENSPPASAPPTRQADSAAHGAPDDEAERQANLAKLSDEDRALAEAQGYCAVAGEPLGSMGPPLKLIVNDQAVFLCCKGCEGKAKSEPDKTLSRVAELKAKVRAEHGQ